MRKRKKRPPYTSKSHGRSGRSRDDQPIWTAMACGGWNGAGGGGRVGGRREGGGSEISWELAVNRKTRYAIFPESPTRPPHPGGPAPSLLASLSLLSSLSLFLPAGGRPHRSPRTAPKRISSLPHTTPLTNTRPTPPRPSLSRIAAPLGSLPLLLVAVAVVVSRHRPSSS